ncbi:MAG: hypothetical protein DRH51_00035 [Candidatus Coatesbacteria bacterium]|nr:MAG: hypothetical protein DRH44_06855 [Candidatus Coatesbacteria bacterium]RLC41998.1 MAG: hypothetical protein DRH49_04530 [Candidatus Coatesbacteria bacterium]RLC42691.1 MAG: hypothetical protein DRH51_00035 [Candidatus Coatesbacteria bacterium]
MRYLVPFLIAILILPMCSKGKQEGELEAVEETTGTAEVKPLEGQSILMIVAQDGFKDVEFRTPKRLLEEAGAIISVASEMPGPCKGVDGLEIEAEYGFAKEEIDLSSYSAVIVVGGPGTIKHLYHNEDLLALIDKASQMNKVIGSICLAPGVLAEAGVLTGKKATVYDHPDARKLFDDNGVTYVKEDVVVDGKIVTASGPNVAEDFGRKIIELLK